MRTLGTARTTASIRTRRSRGAVGACVSLGVFTPRTTGWRFTSGAFATGMITARRARWALARRIDALTGLSSSTWTLRSLTSGSVATVRVALLTVTSRAATLRGVRDHDVGPLLHFRNEFEAFVSRIEWGSRLGSHDRKNLDALHVLLNIGAIDVADHRAAGDE
jgi:hypothetical protein